MNKKLVGGVIAFLLALGFFLLKPKPKKREPLRETAAVSEQREIEKIDPQVERRIRDEQKIVNNRAQLDLKERNIQLKRLPLRNDGTQAFLIAEVALKPTCRPGDADAILMDLKASSGHKIMATLEPLTKGNTPLHWDLPKELFEQGVVQKEFRLPVSEEPSLWGFFLCTAKTGDTSCGEKSVTDINEVFTEHLLKKPKAGLEPRSLFYQTFLLDDWGIAAFADIPRSDERFKEFQKYSVERGIASRESEKAFELSQRNTQTLLSLPFYFNGKTLRVDLPKYRLEACAKK